VYTFCMPDHDPDLKQRTLSLREVLTLQDLTPAERAEEAAERDAAVKRASLYFSALLLLTAVVGGATSDPKEAPAPPAVEAPAPLHGDQKDNDETPAVPAVAADSSIAETTAVMRLDPEQDSNFAGDPITAILNSVISTLR
jgi:hypothetical protein